MKLHACLPLIEPESPLTMGPVAFHPLRSSPKEDRKRAEEQLQKIGYPKRGSCLYVEEKVPENRLFRLIADSLYLLFFASQAPSIYACREVLDLEHFTTLVSLEGQPKIETWEQSGCIAPCRAATAPDWLLQAAAKSLDLLYLQEREEAAEIQKLFLSILYFANCFSCRFNPFSKEGSKMDRLKRAPLLALFLTASYESLFSVNLPGSVSLLKQRLRPLLKLKFGRPIEMIWKWVDSFCLIRNHALQQEGAERELFLGNENFRIPHAVLASKILVYSLCCRLKEAGLIELPDSLRGQPPRFFSIDPKEIIVFLWTELGLLQKILSTLTLLKTKGEDEELASDLHFLASCYLHLLQRYLCAGASEVDQLLFLPEKKEALSPLIQSIRKLSSELSGSGFEGLFPEKFLHSLERRLHLEKKEGFLLS